MNPYWNLRQELYNLFHRWPAMLATLVVGSLLGWGLSFLWPSHYRATSQVYLALNPYRKFEDTIFEALANPKYSNLDNYQYWQMGQLEGAIYLDGFIQPTLEKLRAEDPYWNRVQAGDLRAMLSDEWRTTGSWSLIANHSDPLRAQQATKAWSEIVIKQVSEAVAASRRTFMVDQQLQAVKDERLQASLRQEDLSATLASLDQWQKTAAGTDQGQPLASGARWQLLALATRLADFSPAWMQALEDQPPAGAPVQTYLSWIEQVKPLMQAESGDLQRRISDLDQQQTGLSEQFTIEQRASLSFSPNIEVERKEDLGARLIRPTSTFVLVGGAIGLLMWLLIQLVMITTSRSRQ